MCETWGCRCTRSVFTNGTWLFVACFIVHFVSSTRLPTILRGRVQTLPPTTHKTSPTRYWAWWPFAPAGPASGDYKQTHYLPVHLRCSLCGINVAVYSPGQSVLLQGCVSLTLPVHPLPLVCGGGLLQRRTLVMLPSPHVVVHADQGDQRPQFPSARATHETSAQRWKKKYFLGGRTPGKVEFDTFKNYRATTCFQLWL